MKRLILFILSMVMSAFCFTLSVKATRCPVDFIEISKVSETEDFFNILSSISIIHYTDEGEKEFLASDLEGEIIGTDDHYTLSSTDGYSVQVEKVNDFQIEVVVSKGYAASKIVL